MEGVTIKSQVEVGPAITEIARKVERQGGKTVYHGTRGRQLVPQDNKGQTALMLAAQWYWNSDLLKTLRRAGARKDIRDRPNRTGRGG